jgi:SAM-dependent methyltransferase
MDLRGFVEAHLPGAPARVLEVGCGRGELAGAITSLGYGVVAIDPDAPEGDLFQAVSLEEFADPGPFDAVVANRALHHVADLPRALDKVANLLAHDGRLILREHAFDRLDDATARWYLEQRAAADPGAPCSLATCLADWEDDHAGLHGYAAMREELDRRFDERYFAWKPYLYGERVTRGTAGYELLGGDRHRHAGGLIHAHPHPGPHEHGLSRSHSDHGHSHGLIHESITRSREGVRFVALSLVVLMATTAIQVLIFVSTSSVALLADLIHNFGDALTAVPLGAAFLLRSRLAERGAGYFVVAAIFVSAFVAAVEAINRLFQPQQISHLLVLALAGAIGFIGNEIAAVIRLRGGKQLDSAALIADGNHARVDGFVSLGVVASSTVVALGLQIADPLIGLAITVVILRITWQSLLTIRDDRQHAH